MVPANRTHDQLVAPLPDQQEQRVGILPPELTADAGLDTPTARTELAQRQIVAYIPAPPASHPDGPGIFCLEDFTYDPTTQTLICPAGHTANPPTPDSFQHRVGLNFAFPAPLCRTPADPAAQCLTRIW